MQQDVTKLHSKHVYGCCLDKNKHLKDSLCVTSQKVKGFETMEIVRNSMEESAAKGGYGTNKWIPAHVDIEGNDMADSLANEARTLEPVTSATKVFDANVAAKQKLCSNPRKKLSLPELSYRQKIKTPLTRGRTKHFKCMNILPDGSRS
ncbi:RNase H domain-containing protein [Trichonephila clavipes]|uniref:RNase H domain-containing protein n=1 Tax=Trichonephila clavipes TaxID=2585209 RepID=A0A8X6SYR1_TRICX|nr:RNase H domain-containing protein [Trichonephila clavipes]